MTPSSKGTIAGLTMMGMDDIPNDAGRWLIHGPQGSGKTLLASTIAKMGPTLYIDLTGEKGIRSFKGSTYESNITVVRPSSAQQFDALFWELDAGTACDSQGRLFVAVVVDSLTAIQKMSMRFMLGHTETAVKEIKQGTAPADQRTWGQTLDIMQDFATFWFGLADGNRAHPIHVVMTAQTKVTDDDISATSTRTPDVQKGALGIVLATPDYIVYTEEEADYDNPNDDGTTPTRHIMRFGGHPGYRTKARIPVPLRGRLPPFLGRAPVDPNDLKKGYKSADLAQLSRVLSIGGAKPPVAAKAAAPAAAPKTTASAAK